MKNRHEKEQKCSADKYLDQVNKPEYKIPVRPNYIYKAILSNLFFFSICHLKKKMRTTNARRFYNLKGKSIQTCQLMYEFV